MATQNVNIVFRTIGGNQLNSQLRNLSQNSSMMSRTLSRMQGHMGSMLGGFSMLRTAAVAVLGGVMVNELVSVGDEFERTGIKMAGFLQAMHLAPTYAAGMTVAADVMRKIRRDAAALPGEAEDYARVFTTALPEVSQAIGGSIDDMMKFTNKATAVGTTFGIDSFQLAHDLQRMMYAGRGSAGFHVRLFNELMPFMRNVEGYANLNTKAFNDMDQAARGVLIQKAMAQLDDMIEASRQSFDAMRGAASEAFKSILRFGGMAIFNQVKRIMSGIASAILDANGNLTEFGKIFVVLGDRIGQSVGGAVVWVGDKFNAFTENGTATTQDMINKLVVMKDKFVELGASIAKVVLELKAMSLASDFIKGGGLGKGVTLARNAGVSAKMTLSPIQALGMAAAGGMIAPAMAGPLTPAAAAAATEAAGAASIGTASLVAGLAVLSAILAAIGLVIIAVTDNMTGFYEVTMAALAPLAALWPTIEWFGQSLWKIIKPIALFFTGAVWLAAVGAIYAIAAAIGVVLTVVDPFLHLLGAIFDWLYKIMQAWYFPFVGEKAPSKDTIASTTRGSNVQTLMDAVPWSVGSDNMSSATDVAVPANTIPIPKDRAGTTVNQDFRNSRFTVDQKFAEGFDPDRVAIAFANDLAKISDQRTGSQFASIFSR